QAFSTRAGNVLYLDDLLARAQEKALDIIREKSPDLEDKNTVARQVGVGALVFSALYNSRIKDVDFWWDRALNFDGETGPYVQYTHARCCSVLRKADGISATPDHEALTDDEAQALLRMLSRFPEAVRDAAARYEPSAVTRAVTEIAKAYNKYYYEHRILDGDNGQTAARVLLTRVVRDVIRTGLGLIGIHAPERM
ncbi:MAG: arginine--tRNA ligase, partial [Clostridiales bacterium]|nr:arginine--tRNA ligase [Clostridiales bacterium]